MPIDTADFVNGPLSLLKQRTVERQVAVGHSVHREAGLDGGAAAGAIDFTDPSPKSFDGTIALQLHAGGGGDMMFRDIYVRDLSVR